MMRIIIAGSRSATETQVREAIDECGWAGFATAVVSGTAKGADSYGESWAMSKDLKVLRHPANWEKYGKAAGPVRNREMAQNAEGLIAVWDGVSPGTASMIKAAKSKGLRIFVFRTDREKSVRYSAAGALGELWEAAEERAAMKEFGGGMSRLEAEKQAAKELLELR